MQRLLRATRGSACLLMCLAVSAYTPFTVGNKEGAMGRRKDIQKASACNEAGEGLFMKS